MANMEGIPLYIPPYDDRVSPSYTKFFDGFKCIDYPLKIVHILFNYPQTVTILLFTPFKYNFPFLRQIKILVSTIRRSPLISLSTTTKPNPT